MLETVNNQVQGMQIRMTAKKKNGKHSGKDYDNLESI